MARINRLTWSTLLLLSAACSSSEKGGADAAAGATGGVSGAPGLAGASAINAGLGGAGAAGSASGGSGNAGAADRGATTGGSATGGSATGGSAGSSTTAACPAGSVINALQANAGSARYGTVFGPSLYVDDQPATYQPEKIAVKVTNGGLPVKDCEVAWLAASGNGWLFPDSAKTDASGKLSAYWTAGSVAKEHATASIALVGGGTSQTAFDGAAQPSPETRGDSIHFVSSPGGSYSEYEVQVTPLSAPASTYYETQGWEGAYGGIQFDGASTQVLFSVWDTGGKSSKIQDAGACNKTVMFGGEGTGTSCRLLFPPSKNGAIAGLPSDYVLKAGDTYKTHLSITFPTDCGGACTDYTFSFSDVTRGLGPISLGTQRYMAKADNDYNDVFIEDWDSQVGDTCISAGARTAYFHEMRALIQGTWKAVKKGSFSPNFVPANHEICANYQAVVAGQKFLLSSGGDEYVGAPLFDATRTLSLP